MRKLAERAVGRGGEKRTGKPNEIDEPSAFGDHPVLNASLGWRAGRKPAILGSA